MTTETLKRNKLGGPVLSLEDLRAFDPYAPERTGESDFCCPICGNGKPVDPAHRALSVNLESGAWLCHRCERSGKLRDFWTERPPIGRRPAGRRPALLRKPLTLPPAAAQSNVLPGLVSQSIAERSLALAGSPAADYLSSRGLSLELCETAGVRYAPDWHGRPAALFPILDLSGREIAAQGRYLKPRSGRPNFYTEGPKSGGVFAAPAAWEADEITITEAPIDALSLALSGYPALALVGKSWPDWLPAFIASTRKRVYLAFDADMPDSKGIRAGDEAAAKLAAALRYYDCRSDRLRPGRGKDWNEQLLEVAECRRLCSLLFKQISFLENGRLHPRLGRVDLLAQARKTLHNLTAACIAADGPGAQGYDDSPLDPFAVDCLPMWDNVLQRLQ